MNDANKNKLEHESPAPLERNAKILVNWDKRLIISTTAATDSDTYKKLMALGYDEVGEYKPRSKAFYWLDKFFSVGHKYMI